VIKISKRFLTAGGFSLLALATTSAQADVLLMFDVTNVRQNVCSGAMQPDCVSSAAPQSSFMQTVRFSAGTPLYATGSASGGLLQSQAFYGFPDMFGGSPYTSAMRSRLSGPITSSASFTQLDSAYDSNMAAGISSALISTDAYSDVTDANGFHSQQQYKNAYNFSSGIFNDASLYTDLVNESLGQFFRKYIGIMTGSFDELGSASLFDPQSLAFSVYDFTEYTGDVTLRSVQDVPEPGTLPLISIAALAFIARFRRNKRAALAIG